MHDSETVPNELSKLKDLDNLLKCAICYENLKTTLITPCSHNFCSYCIRQSLSYKNQCPSCFEDVNESQLRNNRVVDEFISIFMCIRERLFKFLRHLPNSKVSCENVETKQVPSERKTLKVTDESPAKSSALKSPPDTQPNIAPSTSKNEGHIPTIFSSKKEVQIPSMFSPKKSKSSSSNEKRVPCPVCTVEIPEKNINVHLDVCLKRTAERRAPQEEKRKPLPKLVYHLLPEKDLRKKLHELGLNTVGDRAALINRHKRYALLYNSECDSLKPRPVSEIVKQLKKEEEEEKKAVPQVVKKLNVDRKADARVNEEAQRQYLEENKTSFQKLIEEARRNKEAKRNINSTVVRELMTIDDTSDLSENEIVIKHPSCKRKIITSDSEGEVEILNESLRSHIEQTGTVHKKDIANQENEVVDSKNVSNCKVVSKSARMSDDSTDTGSDDDFVKDVSLVMTAKINEKRKTSSDVYTSPPSACSNSLASFSSPVLGTKSRLNKTPRSTPPVRDSFKRDLTPLLVPGNSAPRCEVPAGQGPQEDEADSDCSSNHSTSLMVYTGPECDDHFEQTEESGKTSPSHIKTPAVEKSHFDLGIEEILQNSEEFVPLPVRRQSTRNKETKRNTPEPERKARVPRKRVRIDDL